MNKYKNKPVDEYKSGLERTAATLLREHGIWFEYEPYSIVLIDSFEWEIPSYEHIGKNFKLQSQKVRPITYTPDFVGKKFIIETKGKKTPDFQLRWKLFKRYLHKEDLRYVLFMPKDKKEIIKSIEIINQL